jgi:hypothetical protein
MKVKKKWTGSGPGYLKIELKNRTGPDLKGLITMRALKVSNVMNSNNQRRVPHIPMITRDSAQKGGAYKILYPLGACPTPIGCTGIDQSKEWKPSNTT